MNIFLCGQGAGAESVLEQILNRDGLGVCVFSYEGAGLLEMAARRGILRRTASVNEMETWPFQPSLIVSIGYLDILSSYVLGKCDGINCHYALLPKHAGRSAVPWAIIAGDHVTGITWHWMTSEPDRGRVIMQASAQIGALETQASLFEKLHGLVAATWPAALRLAWGGFAGWQQQADGWELHRAGPPFGGVIGEGWSDEAVERFIRAMIYPPLPPATFRGCPVRTFEEYQAVKGGEDGYYF